ncbi:PEP-CTERM sorting domain-containing protein [Alkalimarinus sediminis]|uniref:PEP-CTERM sorting domain-containing protein n=1 Tax=Alkalimarinus sediminis TaxID=1632866 RepID=A0A9E8HII9_9ALTE|nr:PEP-CTERM sorting domain-containing protein [Alkalimarinus sediminis]UZW73353.1 PEP-CTERM sorting domain-containing protein [Alkalimarinus sediminis]
MFNNILALALYSVIYSGTASALLTTPTGYIDGLDLRWGHSESSSLQAYNEAQGVQVASGSVYVDYLLGENLMQGQQYRGARDSTSRLTLGEGRYNSHLLHFDPVGVAKGKVENVTVSFKENIVAIILGHQYLNLSDGIFGHTNTTYQSKKSRRLEAHDLFTLEDSTTLVLNRLRVGRYWVDEARVITYSIPESNSFALFGLGLMGVVGLSIRRRR